MRVLPNLGLPRAVLAAATLLMLAAGMLVPVTAGAQTFATADASRLSCAALQDVIREYGAVTVYSIERRPHINLAERLLTGRSFRDGRSVERYVSHRGFCFYNETTRFRTVTTRDTVRCSVIICVDDERGRFR